LASEFNPNISHTSIVGHMGKGAAGSVWSSLVDVELTLALLQVLNDLLFCLIRRISRSVSDPDLDSFLALEFLLFGETLGHGGLTALRVFRATVFIAELNSETNTLSFSESEIEQILGVGSTVTFLDFGDLVVGLTDGEPLRTVVHLDLGIVDGTTVR
jgi:hypothetical protein